MRSIRADEAVRRLREAGLRATAPRVALLTTLVRDERHPTAEQLHESLRAELPGVALSTVYDSLEAFLKAGLCRRVAMDDRRLRVDGLVEDHDHAVCRGCGAIFDVEIESTPRPERPPELPDGLEVVGLRIEYEVVCAACRNVPAAPAG